MIAVEEEFDAFYGKGVYRMVQNIINDLAPTTRRDEWWSTNGPYEILGTHLMHQDVEHSANMGEFGKDIT